MVVRKEIWRSIKNYIGYYEASNFGRIRSLDRSVLWANGLKQVNGKLLKPYKCANGYEYLNLCKDKKQRLVKVSRIIAQTFIDNPENKKTVNHIDGNKLNNKVYNLEWSTHSENVTHAYNNGLNSYKGGRDIPVLQISHNGNIVNRFKSLREAERVTGVYAPNISRSCKNHKFKAGGFFWSYENK